MQQCARKKECRGERHTNTRAGGEDVRLLHALWLNMPTGEIVLQYSNEAFLGVVTVLGTGYAREQSEQSQVVVDRRQRGCEWDRSGENAKGDTCPNRRSGWDMKSVMRSSMLRGSRTNVGNVTLCRSMPTLFGRGEVRGGECTWVAARESRGVPELRDER